MLKELEQQPVLVELNKPTATSKISLTIGEKLFRNNYDIYQILDDAYVNVFSGYPNHTDHKDTYHFITLLSCFGPETSWRLTTGKGTSTFILNEKSVNITGYYTWNLAKTRLTAYLLMMCTPSQIDSTALFGYVIRKGEPLRIHISDKGLKAWKASKAFEAENIEALLKVLYGGVPTHISKRMQLFVDRIRHFGSPLVLTLNDLDDYYISGVLSRKQGDIGPLHASNLYDLYQTLEQYKDDGTHLPRR